MNILQKYFEVKGGSWYYANINTTECRLSACIDGIAFRVSLLFLSCFSNQIKPISTNVLQLG